MAPLSFKLLLVGDQNVGKSTFLDRTGLFESVYTPTVGVEVHTLNFKTNYGNITLNIYDVGSDVEDDDFEQVCEGADGLILMFDVMNQASYNHLGKWKGDVAKVVGVIPTVVCGNKVDCKHPVVKAKNITFHQSHPETTYYDISVKSHYNYGKPFLSLLRQFTGHQGLQFVV